MSRSTSRDWGGLVMAAAITLTWATALIGLLLTPLTTPLAWLWVPLGVLVLTFLYTGLFITAHDAMHGTLCPPMPRLNHAIGALCAGLHAGMDYRMLRRAHWRHHDSPAQTGDPDWHSGSDARPLPWLLAFMRRYLTLGQALRLMLVYHAMLYVFDLPLHNVLLFWALPSVASTLQLFFVGTWLPHREPPGGHRSIHRATTVDLPPWLSLLACYHFGYHEEHHCHPHEPWWRLPTVRRRALEGT